jgi:hypothetical protein
MPSHSRTKTPAQPRPQTDSPPRGEVPLAPAEAVADGRSASGKSAPTASPPRPAPRVRRSSAARRIRLAADLAGTLEIRDRLRRLADRVGKGAGDPQRAEFIEAAIADCLDEARSAPAADRWLACEAATWALAWMARARRAGGSAGGLLERLVGEARTAEPVLAGGDTLPGRFVVTLARLFVDIEACRRLEPAATTAVAAEIERLTSARGVVNVAGSGAMVDRVTRWTTIREVATATGEPAWGEATERRWREAATNAIRLLGDDGRRLATAGLMPARFTAPLLDAVAALGGRRMRAAEAVVGRRSADGKARRFIRGDVHDTAAAVAIMRAGWERGALRVLVDYRQPVPHLEIAAGDRLLVDGPWQWSVSEGGTTLEAEGPWTASCWESDRQATFLEITAPLAGGRQFERQVVLLPRDKVVLLADAVTTPGGGSVPTGATVASNGHHGVDGGPAPLRYRSMVRLAPGLEAEPAEETREALLFDTRMRLMALPLALPEWRVGRGGSLEQTADGLTLAQESFGRRLYAPLWLDCDADRIGRPLTWRQLTVADTRMNLPAWQAAGFRVQVGREQWLLYRSLDAPRNRTLLGCNVSCDFLVGRLKPRGSVKRVLEIQ